MMKLNLDIQKALKTGITEKQYLNSILKELVRKSIHISSAFVPLVLGVFGKRLTLFALFFALVAYTFSEFSRLRGLEIPVISKITAVAARKRDENRFVLGPVTLSLGIILSILFFDARSATLGIYALSFGDGMASLGGKLFGKIYIPFSNGKTAEGSFTCFLAVFITSFCVTTNTEMSFILAVLTMIIEAFPLNDLDNIFIPIAVSFVSMRLF